MVCNVCVCTCVCMCLVYCSSPRWPFYIVHSSLFQMEPLIKESTSRLAKKISAAAENGETVEALE